MTFPAPKDAKPQMTLKLLKNSPPPERLAIYLDGMKINQVAKLARQAGISARQAANAMQGRPVAVSAFLRLCLAVGFDPLPSVPKPDDFGVITGNYGDFDFVRFALAFRIKRGLYGHTERQAGAAMERSAATISRIENAHELSIGVILRACWYCGTHPLGYLKIIVESKRKFGRLGRVSRGTSVADVTKIVL